MKLTVTLVIRKHLWNNYSKLLTQALFCLWRLVGFSSYFILPTLIKGLSNIHFRCRNFSITERCRNVSLTETRMIRIKKHLLLLWALHSSVRHNLTRICSMVSNHQVFWTCYPLFVSFILFKNKHIFYICYIRLSMSFFYNSRYIISMVAYLSYVPVVLPSRRPMSSCLGRRERGSAACCK